MPQNQAPWADKRILFVSGKGGVGKSLVAAGLAQELTAAGRRVLLAEIGDTSYYKDFWQLPRVGHEPVRLKQGFDLAVWNGESCLREYVLYYLRMERLYSLFFENKVMRALINVAPGLSEIAILGKITSGIRKVGPPLDYDTIVVDCYATGHALALLHAPAGMREAINFGPMATHSRDMNEVIRNPKLCGYIAVTLLEELPVVETLEFREKLKAELGVETELVANKYFEPPLPVSELETLATGQAGELQEFALYLQAIIKRQKQFLAELKASVSGLKVVPLIFSANPEALVKSAGEALRQA